MTNQVLVLLSGGLDSTVLAYHLAKTHEVVAVSFEYGQRHSKELLAAILTARKLRIRHDIIDIQPIFSGVTDGCGSLLNPNQDVPEGHYEDLSMKDTVVPNRNMILMAVAAARAVALKIPQIAYAAHAGDHAIYPDCRPEFAAAMKQAISLCDWSPLELISPFVSISKADIVKLGSELNVPFEDTWSCYKGGKIHCGLCGTCVKRREAFTLANVNDPTSYEPR